MSNDRYVYFLYSKNQYNIRKEVEKNLGKVFIPGKVLNNGRWIDYTEISSNPYNRYADSIVVAEGKINDFNYQSPSSAWG